MTRYFVYLCILASPAGAQQPTAQEVLEKLRVTYSKLTAVHLIAERHATVYPHGHLVTTISDCELAEKGGGRYLARLKYDGDEAILVSDGSNIRRALTARKQWATVSAAALADESDDEEAAQSGSQDLHGVLERMMLVQFLALARKAQDPVLVKEVDFKLGRDKVRCYLIRTHAEGAEHELLVDEQRFVVLQHKFKGESAAGTVETTLKMKSVELNSEVGDSLFGFEPGRGWTEVETLTLPGEQRLTLTGERAADFALKTLDGDTVALASLRGKVIVLDFWATWCGPCRAELPHIEKLRAEFGDAVEFYGVNDEPSATVQKFVDQNHYRMPMLMDDKRDVHRRYGIRAIPALFVIGRDSVIRQQFLGARNESDLRKAIRSVLDSKDLSR